MVRRPRAIVPFPTPAPLFPLAHEPRTALDMIPEVPDPTGRGARAWQILSRLPIVEGQHAGQRIGEHAPPWERRLTRLIFGHTDEQGLRVLRECFVCMAKKNAKSTYAAALALTKLLLDEEQKEQVVCLAANRQQAHIMFDAMASMVRADTALGARFEVVEYRHVITYAQTHSKVTALSAEMASTVGLNASLALIDELHLLGATPKGGKLVRQLRTGSVARKEPLLISISTAPVDSSEGIFEATNQKARRVIAGEEIDPRFFGWLCEVPADLDPEDPANWHWSNPSLGYTITTERLEAELESARSDPAALRDFRSQNLNIAPETSAGIDRWLSLVEWDAAADDTLSLEAVLEEAFKIYIGIDRGGLDDLSAIVVLGKTADGKFLIWSHQWLSRRGYEKRRTVNAYDDFVAAGELTLFEDGAGDLAEIVEVARQATETGKLSLTGIDSYCAPDTLEGLNKIRVEVQSVPQGWKLTPAITWIERLLADGALKHSGTRLLRWNIANAVVTRQGNAVSISKATAVGSGKVDGVAALLDAAAACIARAEEDKPSVYDGRVVRGEKPLLIL
jgi:phage terminase large subunit-like protein